MKRIEAIVIGGSAGGFKAFDTILSSLPSDFRPTIAMVLHVSADSEGLFAKTLSDHSRIAVKEGLDKQEMEPGTAYIAPANYHMLIETDGTLALSVDEKENYSRPSIDVLFESAADAYGESLVGVVLTGASADGAAGLKRIRDRGGFTIVQDPREAESKIMPESALELVKPDRILKLAEIGPCLSKLAKEGRA